MEMNELPPTESERVRRRDRKHVTAMVVDGGNVRRQLEGLRAREWRRRQEEARLRDQTAVKADDARRV
jgi:hypothetical protein